MLGPCFVLLYVMSFLVLQSFAIKRESWMLYFCYVLNAMPMLSFFDPSSGRNVLVSCM